MFLLLYVAVITSVLHANEISKITNKKSDISFCNETPVSLTHYADSADIYGYQNTMLHMQTQEIREGGKTGSSLECHLCIDYRHTIVALFPCFVLFSFLKGQSISVPIIGSLGGRHLFCGLAIDLRAWFTASY